MKTSRQGGPELIDNVGDVDATWLTAVLHASGYRDAKVESFRIKPIGAGNVGDTVRVQLAFSGPTSAPSSLVCKFRCTDAGSHGHGVNSGSYRREVGSYSTMFSAAGGCRTPRLFWVDGGAENINLVIEDLSDRTRAGDQIAGCNPEDAGSVVMELAKLHRSTFPMARDAAPAWAMKMADHVDYWITATDRPLPLVRERLSGRLTDEEMATVEGACAVARAWYLLPVVRGALTHGDPRVDNILFEDRPDGVQAVLIDWQMTGWRNPMHDVGYFLSGSIAVEDRRAHERTFLADYAAMFAGSHRYALTDVEQDYRVQLMSGLLTTTACYGLLELTPSVDRLLITLMRKDRKSVV